MAISPVSETWKVISKLPDCCVYKLKYKTTALPQSIKIGKKSSKCSESICNKMNEHFMMTDEKLVLT